MKTLYILLISLLCVGCSSNKQISKVLGKQGTILVDVRSPEEYQESHINGTVNIPVSAITDSLSFLKNYDHIVVFCKGGGRSRKAKNKLDSLGFKNVLDAGPKFNMERIIEKNK